MRRKEGTAFIFNASDQDGDLDGTIRYGDTRAPRSMIFLALWCDIWATDGTIPASSQEEAMSFVIADLRACTLEREGYSPHAKTIRINK